ncbi:MAG TPA: hypothetical protein PKE61_03270 [Burkholderiaceae bacterium]|nr:hypothetical protein [Burkholderiaceae bacterium]HMY98006.1 hypothetical protein [Burkholderiaceae bacterium]HNB42833.1 hypothetical protein [Burkholderiaceae bacterium]HNG78731.1 hypothetical protein [Burkholderiaceae bacterium]
MHGTAPLLLPDTTLLRALAGADFRRGDRLRDERDGDEEPSATERWLRDQVGWWPPRRVSRRAVQAWGRQVSGAVNDLQGCNDAALAEAFRHAVEVLERTPLADAPIARLQACIGEAARRHLGLWPHPVQFMAARSLMTGRLAEMQTGEGKTLVAAMAAAALAGSGAYVHVVSTNDYLAHRDSEEMTPLFAALGLGCSCVIEGMERPERRQAYRQPICYVSGKELVFDDLKDRLEGHGRVAAGVAHLEALWRAPERIQVGQAPVRGAWSEADGPVIPALHYALVDEADSVLIDEARTPMILSRQADGPYPAALIHWAIEEARCLEAGRDYRLDVSHRQVELLAGALNACQALPPEVGAVWRSPLWRSLLLRQALSALHLYRLDQHYIVQEGKVQIVDESTGRVMADRSWEQGLHQLIEAKEGLALSASRETLARMTFQRFFRRYYLLAGLTGTAAEAHREFWTVYRLAIVRLPPNRPNRRQRLPNLCCADETEKWQRVAEQARQAAQRGQPVLIGTRSVEASERIADVLGRLGLHHVVLNARQDGEEAAIVASAGQAGRITVATNMAGRGTDIRLSAAAREAGGLHVILTEFHESPRVDRQLFGRSGRQGDPGTVRAIVSLQDALFREHVQAWIGLVRWSNFAGLQRVLLRGILPLAQARAERQARRARLQTLEQDRRLQALIGFAGARG